MSADVVIGDWGNSHFRLWRLVDGKIGERREGPGMAGLDRPAETLSATLAGWTPDRVVLSGMAGARGGLREAEYAACPAAFAQWAELATTTELDGVPVRIAPGLAARHGDGHPDVMRGEETQIFGALSLDPALAKGRHLLALPGTHSKWATVDEGRIVAFDSYMTGELFALLQHSALLSLAPPTTDDQDAGFAHGLARAEARNLTSSLLEARAAQLRDGKSSGWARGFVSGLLIGSETLAHAATEPQSVTLIGAPDLVARYRNALAHWGVESDIRDGEECAIAGLRLFDAAH